jgi:hypothetical protein
MFKIIIGSPFLLEGTSNKCSLYFFPIPQRENRGRLTVYAETSDVVNSYVLIVLLLAYSVICRNMIQPVFLLKILCVLIGINTDIYSPDCSHLLL